MSGNDNTYNDSQAVEPFDVIHPTNVAYIIERCIYPDIRTIYRELKKTQATAGNWSDVLIVVLMCKCVATDTIRTNTISNIVKRKPASNNIKQQIAGLEKITDFFVKIKKIGFICFKSEFYDLNQIFLIFLLFHWIFQKKNFSMVFPATKTLSLGVRICTLSTVLLFL